MGKVKSVLVDDLTKCYVCGSPYVQMHHCIYGTNRKNSDRLGFIVPLCMEHHTGGRGVHFNKALDLYLKKISQQYYENNIGTREEFIELFGKSYL